MMERKSKPLVIIQTYENRNGKGYSGITDRLTAQNQSETLQKKSSIQDKRTNGNTSAPPPPPLPILDVITDKLVPPSKHRCKPPPPPVPQKVSNQPPPCPTPDYDNLSINSNSTLPRKPQANSFLKRDFCQNGSNDAVEMESLESFKLNGTNDTTPKPPNTYFNKTKLSGQLSNGSTTSTLTKKSVNVTIGGYPSGAAKKQIKKLDFLNGSGSDTIDRVSGQSISSQLASELAQTLNRSNLRKRTESVENLLNHPQIKAESNGSVRIAVNSSLGKQLAKSTNDLTNIESYRKPYSNRVTILCIPSNDKKHDIPNGILKNGQHSVLHRPLVQQKSITFGPTPTVINEPQLNVT